MVVQMEWVAHISPSTHLQFLNRYPYPYLMIITDLQFDPLKLATIAGNERSPGLHVSDIYQDLASILQKNEPMEYEELAHYRAGGFIWERVMAAALNISMVDVFHPGEFQCDGIIGSPDALRVMGTGGWHLVETKCTWKSVRKFDDHLEKFFWVWLVQMKAYCHMLEIDTAELYAFFVNGDYRGSGPCSRARQFEFSKIELLENWNMLTQHAKRKGWL